MTICAVSFLWKCCCTKTFAVFWLSQCQTNEPGVVALGDLGALPRTEVSVLSKLDHDLLEEYWTSDLLHFLVFSISDTIECLLTLSFFCLLSVHGLLRLLAPGIPKFAPERAETVTFLFFKTMVPTLFQKRCLVSSRVPGFTLTEKGPQDWCSPSFNVGTIMKTASHVSVAKLALHED